VGADDDFSDNCGVEMIIEMMTAHLIIVVMM
jgi:hypothetical protein